MNEDEAAEFSWVTVVCGVGVVLLAMLVSRCGPCDKWAITHWVGENPVSTCVKWKDGNP